MIDLKNEFKFQPAPEVWPVIHIFDITQALAAARIADACGCPGIFLISMSGDDGAIDPIAREIRAQFPKLKIGVNYLTLDCTAALLRSLGHGHDATWADYAGIHSGGVDPVGHALSRLKEPHPDHMFFAGVAFKHQLPDQDPAQAALYALDLGLVPTTSGEATGIAAPAEKLAGIRNAIGGASLAIASGMAPGNVADLGRYLTHILVATGISMSFYEFDEKLLRLLLDRLPRRALTAPGQGNG